MLRHLLKLVWKRKGRNLMLSLEILLAFLIVFTISAVGMRYYQLYRMPLGFAHDDVWAVRMLPPNGARGAFADDIYPALQRGLRELPEVESVGFANTSPFRHAGMHADFKVPATGRILNTAVLETTDEFFGILGMQAASGRFFHSTDNAAEPRAVVVNRRFARDMFGTEDVVGRQFDASERSSQAREMMVITGLVDDFRKTGELEAPHPVAIMRHVDGAANGYMEVILLKVAPGTPRAFEEKLQRRLTAIRNDWGYEIEPLAAARTASMNEVLTPLVIAAMIAAFLLPMVAAGLFGVLWQNTTRRIPEMGLRRAVGANAGDIYRQIVCEQLLLSSGAMLAGLLLLVQLPITGALGDSLNWSVFVAAAALAMAVIYLLSLLCALQPGWRASRLSPTQALHYE
jgi:putative ABC transport system permease protein